MAYEKKNRRGSKPRYESPEEMQKKIDEYFKKCEGTLLLDHNEDPIINKWGEPVYVDRKPPTITGLALALGFKTRLSLQDYADKKAFEDIILVAKSRVELFNEEQLYTRDGAKGAMFNLQRNFRGWKEDKADDNKGPAVNIINDIPQGGTVNVNTNTETAVFNPLQKPEDTENNGEK